MLLCSFFLCCFFFFNDTATTEIYTLSLHDALPIWHLQADHCRQGNNGERWHRSEEHTSELQSHHDLVCRLLLEKKKTKNKRETKNTNTTITNQSDKKTKRN